MNVRALIGLAASFFLLAPAVTRAADSGGKQPAGKADPLFGHSAHGEAFNEGPRQQAHLMEGNGKVHLPVTARAPQVQAFFDQGVGQLHGFWYFEAERSFRQVAALDPDCAMAYWGMAMANVNNPGRARGFIQQAVERKSKVSPREQRWIDLYAAYWGGKKDERGRRQDLVQGLEELAHDFSTELEAKAFLAFQLWDNSNHGIALPSRSALDALMKEVLAAEPLHPVHHYRIHLWDGDRASWALDSAARCGQSAPNIAHMWHMPGHIYVRLHRYADAAWQQEASARVDHRHMMEDRYLPDQIHNYAHNNQWLVENLEYAGRAHDAVALARNMIELPRHPRYNTLGLKPDGSPLDHNNGSSALGRRRLFEALERYELWDELIALAERVYLEPTDIPAEQVRRLRAVGVACFGKGDAERGRQQIKALEALGDTIKADKQAGRKPKFGGLQGDIDTALVELHAGEALARGDRVKASDFLRQARDVPQERLAQLWLAAGDKQQAEKLARESAAGGENQVYRLANYIDVLHRCGKSAEAREQFQRLRPLSADIDLDVPVMKRLAPVAKALGLPADWRVAKSMPSDVGQRPNLQELGPLHWRPMPAPDWSLEDEHGKRMSLRDYRGKPVVVILFLGRGCPHCLEQLNVFKPMASKFSEAGISVVGISADTVEGLQETCAAGGSSFGFPLVSDHDLKVFRAYRAFDDFEKTPLHGTFLIDGQGLVRWQDISYEPFTEPRFLLDEARRLLNLPVEQSGTAVSAAPR